MAEEAARQIVRGLLAELWYPLPTGPGTEFEGVSPIYWVSTKGRVVMINPTLKPGQRVRFKVLRMEIRKKRRPHLKINLNLPGHRKYRTARLHRVVLATFELEGRPEGKLGLHKDGNPTNNALSNLRYGTCSENLRDTYAHGGRTWGKACAGCDVVCPWCAGA